MNREEQAMLAQAGENLLTSADQLPTTAGDVFGAMFDMFTFEETSDAQYDNEATLVDKAMQSLYRATNRAEFSEWSTTIPGQYSPRDPVATFKRRRDILAQQTDLIQSLKTEHPDLQTLDDVRSAIKAQAKQQRDRLASISSRATPTARFFGMLVGAAAGAFTDPINLATLPLGLPKAVAQSTSTLSRIMLSAGYGAAISGATELAIQPFVFDYKKELDSPYTAGDAALNIFAAAVGGGVLLGGAAAIPPLAKAGGESLSSLYRKAVKRGDIPATADGDAAAEVLEQAARVSGQNPLQPTPAAAEAHLEAVEQAQRQLDADQVVDVADITAPHRVDSDPFATGEIRSLDPLTIGVDAERFQFKAGTGPDGVSERLQGVTRWEPELADVAMVWEDSTGKLWIVDGHQRLGLAKRLKAQGDQDDIHLNAMILRESDGVTAREATARAAMKNIAVGTGTAIDAARVLRTMDDALKARMPELPPNSPLVRDAAELAKLSEEAFRAVVNEVLPARFAAMIGRHVTDPSKHLSALDVMAKHRPENLVQAEIMARDIEAAGFQRSEQGGLFGDDEVESLFKERAKAVDLVSKTLRRDRATFRTLVDRQADIMGHGENRLDVDANTLRMTQDQMALASLLSDATAAGPLSDALNQAARAIKAGTNPREAIKPALAILRGGETPQTVRIQASKMSKSEFDREADMFIESQMGRTIDEQIELSRGPSEQLGAWGKKMRRKFGAKVHFALGPLKGPKRMAEKLREMGETDAGFLTDVARGGFIIDDFADVEPILQELAKQFDVLDEGFKHTPVGYFDYTVKVRFDNDTVGELQFWDAALLIAKEGTAGESWIPKKYLKRYGFPEHAGHHWYEIWRDKTNPQTARDEASAAMSELYADALKSSTDSWRDEFARVSLSPNRATQSARDISADSDMTVATSKSRQPVDDKMNARSSSSATTGDSSYRPKTLTSSNENGIDIDQPPTKSIPEDADLELRVQQIMTDDPNAVIADLVDDGQGGVEVVVRPAREVFDEIDAESKAIDDIITCMTGATVANT